NRIVLRGGSWLREAKHCRSAARYSNDPGSRNADNGFRLVSEAEEPERPGWTAVPLKGKTSPAVAPTTPMPSPGSAPARGVSGSWGAACLGFSCGASILAGVMTLIWLARRLPRGTPPLRVRPPARPPGAIQPRAADDGFWVQAPEWEPGSTVRYR